MPDDRTVVIERCRDELGDWRLCVLSPLGGRIHAPWAMAVVAKVRRETGVDVETMWTDDGFVVRFPDTDDPPDAQLALPDPDEVEALVLGQLGATALFAARFREAAARALLLPRRRPGGRAPLWQQRKRAADLLAVAARFGSFPMLLETYRECLRDVFDMPALVATLRDVATGAIRTVTLDSRGPSPFAAALLFGYVANYIYEGDAPLAERRAQALAIDQAQLRELLGAASLRELLDADAIAAVERQLQHLDERPARATPTAVHDLLLRVGDLSLDEVRARTVDAAVAATADSLVAQQRVVLLPVAGAPRYVAIEDATPLPRRPRHPPPTGHPRGTARGRTRPARRPGASLRAHARALHHRRRGPPLRAGPAGREYFDGQTRLPVILRTNLGETPEALAQAPLMTPSGEIVSLGELVNLQTTLAPEQIRRIDHHRTVTLTIDPPPTLSLEDMLAKIDSDIVPSLRAQLPPDANIRLAGSADRLDTIISTMGMNFLLALLVLFMLMAAMFRSLRDAAVVVLTVPLALAGGVLGIRALGLVTFQPLDLLTMIGFIMMIGIIVNHSILLVDRTRDALNHGHDLEEALRMALNQRLRAMVASTLTGALGALPMVVNPGPASTIYRGLAAVNVAGVIVSMVFSIVLLPSLLRLVYERSVPAERSAAPELRL